MAEQRPLWNFVTLTASIVVIAVSLAMVSALLAQWLAPRVSFDFETRLANRFVTSGTGGGAAERYLADLAARITRVQPLPKGITVRVHYRDEPVVNAFATLGGHVFIFRGLIEAVADENTLAMVLAHEIAHVAHRHPVSALGRGLAFAAVVSMVSGVAGDNLATRLMGDAGLLTQLSFSRAQEEQADASALAAVVALYGHAGGAADLFKHLREAGGGRDEPPRFLATHPLSDERIERLRSVAAERGWQADGPRTLIPLSVRPDTGESKQR